MGTSDSDVRGHQELARGFSQPTGAAESSRGGFPLSAADDPQLQDAIARLEYLTPVGKRRIFDKGRTGVLDMSGEELREAGLVPETWSLEVVADAASGTVIEQPLERATKTVLDWSGLMRLADTQAVRFLHPCFCTNVDDPLHVDLWEGVPLRDVIWMAKPIAAIRRVYYQSYSPEHVPPFQASLPLGNVLETPPGQVPVVLAYKMNGEVIPAAQGGPVRVVVPGTYGNKSIKWVQRIVLTNDFRANDTDASDFNSDTDTPMKTKARFIDAPTEATAGRPVALVGFVLIGISGIQKVQYCVHDQREPWLAEDPYWTKADWKDAEMLPPPASWGGGLEESGLPANTSLIDPAKSTPLQWPIRFTIAHWAALLTGLPSGNYDLCCRTIDGNGIAQPMPRPLLRTGANGIHRVTLTVKD